MTFVRKRPRLKKKLDLWSKFRLGPKIRTSRQAHGQSAIQARIHSWSTIHCVFNSANPLDLTSKIHNPCAFLKAKSINPKTYSPPSLKDYFFQYKNCPDCQIPRNKYPNKSRFNQLGRCINAASRKRLEIQATRLSQNQQPIGNKNLYEY